MCSFYLCGYFLLLVHILLSLYMTFFGNVFMFLIPMLKEMINHWMEMTGTGLTMELAILPISRPSLTQLQHPIRGIKGAI